MPQLVLWFAGSFYVCYSGFLCVFKITTAGVTDLKQDKLDICFQCLTKCILCFNCCGTGMVPAVLQPEGYKWSLYSQHHSSNVARNHHDILVSQKWIHQHRISYLYGFCMFLYSNDYECLCKST